jgi:L-aminopeptidase/D-esterase-like protein
MPSSILRALIRLRLALPFAASVDDMPVAVGAIIYDFHRHRLNEIYPDKRLAVTALKSLRPGVFALGAQGAGRMAMQGGLFNCAAHSGQGAAFRQIGYERMGGRYE